jgi:hypothetical protein
MVESIALFLKDNPWAIIVLAIAGVWSPLKWILKNLKWMTQKMGALAFWLAKDTAFSDEDVSLSIQYPSYFLAQLFHFAGTAAFFALISQFIQLLVKAARLVPDHWGALLVALVSFASAIATSAAIVCALRMGELVGNVRRETRKLKPVDREKS